LNFDRVADRYDETRGGTTRGASFAADLDPFLPAGPVLEVAVGTGLVATGLRDRGRAVFGVDLSAEMLARARERLGGLVVRGNALALPVADGAVAGVVYVAALHAIGDVNGALTEAARVLRPDGRVVAVTGEGKLAGEGHDEIRKAMASLRPLRQARPDTKQALAAAAERAGLRVVERTATTPLPSAESPTEVADRLEQRLYSYLWDMDAQTWDAVVQPAIDALRNLPEPDRPRQRIQQFLITVLAHAD
jgi:SAM-dependent methyltransferase